jgi:hypothetical protein
MLNQRLPLFVYSDVWRTANRAEQLPWCRSPPRYLQLDALTVFDDCRWLAVGVHDGAYTTPCASGTQVQSVVFEEETELDVGSFALMQVVSLVPL